MSSDPVPESMDPIAERVSFGEPWDAWSGPLSDERSSIPVSAGTSPFFLGRCVVRFLFLSAPQQSASGSERRMNHGGSYGDALFAATLNDADERTLGPAV